MEIIKANRRVAIIGLLLVSLSVGTWTAWAVTTHSWPFCGGSIFDGTYVPMSVQNLTQTSDMIIVGSVSSIGPSWVFSTGQIVTNVTVSVSESLKPQGSSGQTEILAAGGTIGCYTEKVSTEPKFTQDEQVLVFLVKGPGYLRVTGSIQGKYMISGDYAYAIDPSHGMVLLSDLISEIQRYL